jgi:transposase-like protein
MEFQTMKKPPFCPNRCCINHQINSDYNVRWYYNCGSYSTKRKQGIKRFRCKSCSKRFSTQTFSLEYALKKKGSFRQIFSMLKACSGIRDMARDLKIAPGSVLLRLSRLARQATAFHAEMKGHIHLNEDFVADGFESFVVSQYFPNNINILVGKQSQFLYTFDYSQLRRKGKMTKKQKKRNRFLQKQVLYRRTVTASFTDLCHAISYRLWNCRKQVTILYTDKKNEYKQVLKLFVFPVTLKHIAISSRLIRTVDNDLFAVNYMDRQFRMCLAEHVRETVRFARNVNNSMERMAIYGVYHNYMKPYRINRADDAFLDRTHAEVAGLPKGLVKKKLRTFFTRRLVLSRCGGIDSQDLMLWNRCYATPLNNTFQVVPAYAA